jgi:pimeloyl-ACP methyl ester carboxylesterase
MRVTVENMVFRGRGVEIAADRWTSAKTSDTGRTVLLLHGGGQTRHAWRRTCQQLALAGWSAIAPDTRGHGDSSWAPDGAYDMDDFVADLHAIVRAIGVRPVIVGASIGGLTALIAQGCDPSLASGLVLVDVVPRVDPQGSAEVTSFMRDGMKGFDSLHEAAAAVARYNPRRRTQANPDGIRKNLRQRDGRWYWHWDPRVLDGHDRDSTDGNGMSDKGAHNQTRALAAARMVTVPVLVVRGAQSNVTSSQGVQELVDLVPGSQSIEIEGAGHMVAGDDNAVFAFGLVDFLENHFPRAS